MTVTAVRKDPTALTMTTRPPSSTHRRSGSGSCGPIRASWSAGGARRPIPRPSPTHDLAPGSRVEYHMTGPEGDQPRAFWDIVEVDAPRSLVVPRRLRERRRHAEHRPARRRRSACGSRRSATDGRRCRSRAPSRAPRRWSSSSPWAWRRASRRPSARSTRSWRRMPSAPRSPTDEFGRAAESDTRNQRIQRRSDMTTMTRSNDAHPRGAGRDADLRRAAQCLEH